MATHAPKVRYNTQLLAEDAALKFETTVDWASKADLSDMTVIRFMRGERQTNRTFQKLSKALGHKPERYLIRSTQPENPAVSSDAERIA